MSETIRNTKFEDYSSNMHRKEYIAVWINDKGIHAGYVTLGGFHADPGLVVCNFGATNAQESDEIETWFQRALLLASNLSTRTGLNIHVESR